MSAEIHTAITPEQVEDLEVIFAYLTPKGWRFPVWLEVLSRVVASRYV